MSKNYYEYSFKRIFDFLIILFAIPIVIPIVMILIILFIFSGYKNFIFVSRRVGLENRIFSMYKFRTMEERTPQLATHLLKKSNSYITSIGYFLRKTSLDEIPQIINVIKGNMSIVGPRPALYNQYDLINQRKKYKIHFMRPGITGWAQVNGRDNLSISQKIKLDLYYKTNQSLLLDIKILFLTIINVIFSKGLKH